jgi:hypothetical protein
VATPNSATTANIFIPICRSIGRYESRIVVVSAPLAGAERSRPSPTGPASRMSLA